MPRTSDQYLLPLTIRRVGDGTYLGRCDRLPGLLVQADSVDEVVRLAPRVARALILAMKRKGVRIPASLSGAKTPIRVQMLVAA
jgi:predicted RNase H-like HicB family nuclease